MPISGHAEPDTGTFEPRTGRDRKLASSLTVTVVVPVRNRERVIGACIESLLGQTYPKDLTEVIVVDNGSTDRTIEIVRRYPVTLLSETRILTSYAARNHGIDNAHGDVIALIDSDCVASDDWLMHLVEPFGEASVGAVTGAILDATSASLAEEFTARVTPFAKPVHGGLKTLLTANAAVRTSVLRAIGAFDERLPTGGDVDLGWRLQQELGVEIHETPAARVSHKHRSTFRGVFSQFRRYGLSQVVLTTMYRGGAGSSSNSEQLRRLLRQGRAIASYLASIFLRSVRFVTGRCDRRHLLWPVFLLVAETANVYGKLGGLIQSRFYRRNPYANPRIARSA